MNINEYISSGILESYVLGELSEQERLEVEKNLVRYPELQSELRAIEEAQEIFLQRAAINPRASVKDELFSKINPKSEAKVVDLPAKNVSFWKFAAAASVSIAIVSSVLAYHYWNKWRSTDSYLTQLIAQNQRIAQDYNQVNQRLEKFETDLSIIDDPRFSKIVMNGTANSPDALASVYWNESTSEVYLKIRNLKALAKENQYQLWAIIDGKPVDAGVFDGNIAGLIKMKEIGKGAAAFAVTIEPRGGKASPTLETMQVLGNVKKG